MPAKSKSQRRLFGMALQHKKGKLEDVTDEIKELSKLPLKTLEDYAKTKEAGLPDRVDEDLITESDVSIVSNYTNELVKKFNKFIEGIQKETRETKAAYTILINSFKNNTKLSSAEKTKIGNQFRNVLKLIGFSAATVLPGGIIYLLLSRISALKKHMIPPSFLNEGSREPSSGTSASAGGGFPFGYEFVSKVREAPVELSYLKKDLEDDEINKKMKTKTKDAGRTFSYEEFKNTTDSLQEMDGGAVGGGAASGMNTPGMGNVVPGETGSGDTFGGKNKKSNKGKSDSYKDWKKKSKANQDDDEDEDDLEKNPSPAYEYGKNSPGTSNFSPGAKMAVSVVNTVR